MRCGRRCRAGRLPLPRSNGFTLVELLVCLAIASVLAVMSLPYVAGGAGRMRLESEARGVAALLRGARERALAERQPIAVRIDPATRSVTVDGGRSSYRLSASEQLGLLADDGGAKGFVAAIVFAPDGGSSGGLLVMKAGGHQLTLDVDWLTGAVTMEGG